MCVPFALHWRYMRSQWAPPRHNRHTSSTYDSRMNMSPNTGLGHQVMSCCCLPSACAALWWKHRVGIVTMPIASALDLARSGAALLARAQIRHTTRGSNVRAVVLMNHCFETDAARHRNTRCNGRIPAYTKTAGSAGDILS